uniref:Uncharacterized protein n=1 Tax=Heliothis virescens TaxID=7102 RepID=A0A2A4K6Z4_HELVI
MYYSIFVAGSVAKPRTRRPLEAPHPKTESSLPSSKVSPKTTLNLSFGIKSTPLKSSPSNSTPTKTYDRRRSPESVSKPSCIPLSKKSADRTIRTSTSPVKQDLTRDTISSRSKAETPRSRTTRKSPEKAKSDTENNRIDRRHRAQKDSESLSEKYHYSKKRLTSLENNSPRKLNETKNVSPKNLLNVTSRANQEPNVNACGLENSKITKMSTLHETVRPHNSRLSQEMDSLAALTKQTLDRVNKLSNNLTSNKINLDTSEPRFDSIFAPKSELKHTNHAYNYGLISERPVHNRGVTERLRDIDTAAQRLIDFEKQSAMFSDLNNDTSSQSRRLDTSSTSCSHTPVSILKRKSIHEDSAVSNTTNQAIASPPVTFSPNVVEPRNGRSDSRQRQGILKKRRSLDESQVARRRSCSPEVSFAEDGSLETNKSILKNRRSSLEDVVRNRSPDGQIQGILKRKMSREEEHHTDDLSQGSPEPHGILKRKSNSSSSSSTASSHVSIAQAVLLAAAGGAEIVEDDKEIVRPILKKKSFSEERPCPDVVLSDTPKPILKKKSTEFDDFDFDLPKKPILKSSKKLSGDEGHASSFDLSEDDRSSRRPSLLRSRTSDHSGSECEAAVRPILKQRGSSLTRERSQSPRPRLSFCADNDANIISVTNFSCDANDLSAAGPRRVLNLAPAPNPEESYPSAVLRRRNLRPKTNPRSKSLACDVNDELLSILNNRRLKVDENCENGFCEPWNHTLNNGAGDEKPKSFPSIASRIKSMEQALTKDLSPRDQPSTSRAKTRDKERYKTQPITVDEMRSITSSLEPGQARFQAFGPAGCSFPSRPVESGVAPSTRGSYPLPGEPERDPFADFAQALDSPPYGVSSFSAKSPTAGNCFSDGGSTKDDSYGEATFLDFENIAAGADRKQSTLDDIEQEVNKVRVALDEDCRALEEDERHQAEADNWSLNVSCDSGVYNRASSRDSGPHSGEELGLIESQEIRENHATNSSSNEWSPSSIERGLLTMDRERKSTETEAPRSPEEAGSDDEGREPTGFALGLVKSNSVVARASMWQQLQQQAKGTPKPLLRHSRSKLKEGPSVADRFKSQPISFPAADVTPSEPTEQPTLPLPQSKSAGNVLDRDEDAKLDEDDPAKMSLSEKMKMFNSKLTHKPPVGGAARARAGRLRTMPVCGSQLQEAMEQNERLTKSLTHDDVPHLDDDSPSERAQRMITPEVRGILKSGSTVVPPRPKTLAKGESSEGLKDEGIDSSSDEDSVSASSVSSSEKSCSSSDSSDELPDPKPRRFQRKPNKLKASRTESDIPRHPEPFSCKIKLPGANELKERLTQAKNPDVKIPMLAKLGRKPSEEAKKEEDQTRYRRFVKKLDEPIQLGKLRRPADKVPPPPQEMPPPVLKISALNQAAKNKFFGLETAKKEKTIDELAAAVRKYIPPVSKSMSTHTMEVPGSGSDGESSGGREVRHINTRVRHSALVNT